MGAVLLAAGTKGKRRVLPNCEDDPPAAFRRAGQATDIQIHAEHTLAIKARLTQLMAEFCGKDAAEIGADMERDHFLTAQEAVNYGLADAVVNKRGRNMTSSNSVLTAYPRLDLKRRGV